MLQNVRGDLFYYVRQSSFVTLLNLFRVVSNDCYISCNFDSFLEAKKGCVSIYFLLIVSFCLHLLQYREERFRQTSESTNQRVLWWSIAQTVILLVTGFWQMKHLKSFFEAKKLV